MPHRMLHVSMHRMLHAASHAAFCSTRCVLHQHMLHSPLYPTLQCAQHSEDQDAYCMSNIDNPLPRVCGQRCCPRSCGARCLTIRRFKLNTTSLFFNLMQPVNFKASGWAIPHEDWPCLGRVGHASGGSAMPQEGRACLGRVGHSRTFTAIEDRPKES